MHEISLFNIFLCCKTSIFILATSKFIKTYTEKSFRYLKTKYMKCFEYHFPKTVQNHSENVTVSLKRKKKWIF